MDLLLQEVLELCWPHARTKNEHVNRWFTRQLHERVANRRLDSIGPIDGWAAIDLSETAVTVRRDSLTTEALAAFGCWHNGANPGWRHVPVIIFDGWSVSCLIDGQNRVNLWRREKVAGPHKALIVSPKATSDNPFPGAGASPYVLRS